MQADQIMQLMNLNNMNGLQGISQSAGNSGLYDSSSMFQSLLQTQINNMMNQGVSGEPSLNSANQSGIGGLSLQPEKINQMIQVMLLQSMLSGSSIGGSDDDSISGSSSSNNNMSQLLELMLMNMINNQQTQNTTNTQQSVETENGSSNVNSNSNKAEAPETPKFVGKIANSDIEEAISKASQKYGVDEDFVKAVIKQESGFHQNAVSSAGAIGLMQLMPGTARSLGVNPYDPVENIEGGTKYLKNLLDAFSGSKELALAAYNGGISRMNRLGVDTTEEISKMPKETRNYVANVIKIYQMNKNV